MIVDLDSVESASGCDDVNMIEFYSLNQFSEIEAENAEEAREKAGKMIEAKQRLEYIRAELDLECISQDTLLELESLVEYIKPDDVRLLEAAGVPEQT